MSINAIANLISFPVGIVCLILSIRAFYIYSLSRSELLAVLGFAMGSIATGIFVGNVGEAHLFGITYNTEWARYTGSSSGALFLFLSSLVKSHAQVQKLRRWQVLVAIFFVIVIGLTPILPPFASPWIPFGLNSIRILIYGATFIRYTGLYLSKGTRFSLIISIGFILLVIGFSLNAPGLLAPGFATLTITGAFVRIVGYSTMSLSYSVK
jgi:hypothetical protein